MATITKITKIKRVLIFRVLFRCNINFAKTNGVIQQERKQEYPDFKICETFQLTLN